MSQCHYVKFGDDMETTYYCVQEKGHDGNHGAYSEMGRDEDQKYWHVPEKARWETRLEELEAFVAEHQGVYDAWKADR